MDYDVTPPTISSWLPALEALAKDAGEAIMALYQTDYQIAYKADHSPATAADTAAEAIIIPALQKLAPAIPIVAEEQVAAGNIPTIDDNGPFWLVDPLDGTKEFIAKTGEFTVNIGLIYQRQPILGVIHAPTTGEMYSGVVSKTLQQRYAVPTPINLSATTDPLSVITSRRCKPAALPPGYTTGNHILCGSSLKFCRLVTAHAHIYPRPGRTMEWDTAAGDAILRANGGCILTQQQDIYTPLRYQKPDFANPAFTAVGKTLLA